MSVMIASRPLASEPVRPEASQASRLPAAGARSASDAADTGPGMQAPTAMSVDIFHSPDTRNAPCGALRVSGGERDRLDTDQPTPKKGQRLADTSFSINALGSLKGNEAQNYPTKGKPPRHTGWHTTRLKEMPRPWLC